MQTFDLDRSLKEMENVYNDMLDKWERPFQQWWEYPHDPEKEYLMLFPGSYKTELQKKTSMTIPSSMRTVDGSAEMVITSLYDLEEN